MKLLLPHDDTDFDAFACLFAAKRLHPDGVPTIGRRLQPPVREYLGLHRDLFDTRRATDLDGQEVDSIVLLDTRRIDRLPPVPGIEGRIRARDPSLSIVIYDHHPASPDDAIGNREVVEPVGAAVTLLVEELQKSNLAIEPAEATLFALGIYADTGSLRFASTTGRDAAAAAWLLDQGARLDVMNRFLRNALNAEQRSALGAMLGSVEIVTVGGGARVGIVEKDFGGYRAGLATVVRHVLELEGHEALFAILPMGRQGTQVIGRSSVPHVDVARILAPLGGGGHRAAGAVRLRPGADEDVRSQLLERIEAERVQLRTVADVMSSPVRSVAPDMPLATLEASLEAWRHTGVPVVDDGRLLGIVSRRDIATARRDGRIDLPVASCMTQKVITITPEMSLRDALDRMSDANVGRLPVERDGHVVGILARSDAMRILYGPPGS